MNMPDYYDMPFESDSGGPGDFNGMVFETELDQERVYETLEAEWNSNGFSAQDIFDMIKEVIMHEDGTFEFYWESDDGNYGGWAHGG
jgi:hypothetical protein